MNRRSFFRLLGAGAAAAAVAPAVLARGVSADAITEASRIFARAYGGTVTVFTRAPGESDAALRERLKGRQSGKTMANTIAMGDALGVDLRPIYDGWQPTADAVAASLAEAINEALA